MASAQAAWVFGTHSCSSGPAAANRGTSEQVNPTAQLRPLKSRVEGQFRDIPLPLYVSEAIDKQVADHGTTEDGYLFRGRRHKHETRRTHQDAGLDVR